ncbi:MAG: amidohydrolase family protein, partial [Planctomycetota bacterium]|jgi:imidazolonepropionase-like amidohydrolase
MATIHGARTSGREAELGSIAQGKRADLVVMDGDPLREMGIIGSRARAVFRDGRLEIDEIGLAGGKERTVSTASPHT